MSLTHSLLRLLNSYSNYNGLNIDISVDGPRSGIIDYAGRLLPIFKRIIYTNEEEYINTIIIEYIKNLILNNSINKTILNLYKDLFYSNVFIDTIKESITNSLNRILNNNYTSGDLQTLINNNDLITNTFIEGMSDNLNDNFKVLFLYFISNTLMLENYDQYISLAINSIKNKREITEQFNTLSTLMIENLDYYLSQNSKYYERILDILLRFYIRYFLVIAREDMIDYIDDSDTSYVNSNLNLIGKSIDIFKVLVKLIPSMYLTRLIFTVLQENIQNTDDHIIDYMEFVINRLVEFSKDDITTSPFSEDFRQQYLI